jgi:uncharacterized protein (UPF0333 family)
VNVDKSSALAFTTTGSDELFVSGFIKDPITLAVITHSVRYILSANNYNDFVSGITYGKMTATVESLSTAYTEITNNTQVFYYPYSVSLDESNTEAYLYINAAVNYTCDKQVYVDGELTGYLDTIDTSAVYNRSNDADRTM